MESTLLFLEKYYNCSNDEAYDRHYNMVLNFFFILSVFSNINDWIKDPSILLKSLGCILFLLTSAGAIYIVGYFVYLWIKSGVLKWFANRWLSLMIGAFVTSLLCCGTVGIGFIAIMVIVNVWNKFEYISKNFKYIGYPIGAILIFVISVILISLFGAAMMFGSALAYSKGYSNATQEAAIFTIIIFAILIAISYFCAKLYIRPFTIARKESLDFYQVYRDSTIVFVLFMSFLTCLLNPIVMDEAADYIDTNHYSAMNDQEFSEYDNTYMGESLNFNNDYINGENSLEISMLRNHIADTPFANIPTIQQNPYETFHVFDHPVTISEQNIDFGPEAPHNTDNVDMSADTIINSTPASHDHDGTMNPDDIIKNTPHSNDGGASRGFSFTDADGKAVYSVDKNGTVYNELHQKIGKVVQDPAFAKTRHFVDLQGNTVMTARSNGMDTQYFANDHFVGHKSINTEGTETVRGVNENIWAIKNSAGSIFNAKGHNIGKII